MDDLISRQAAIDAMKDMYRAAEKWLRDATDDATKARAESCMASLVEIKLRTEKLPAVRPEIIRCKDCKHYLHDEEYGFDWCNRMSGVFRAKPDGFCSWADMRGGGTE